jgi:hypothetical protein
LFLPCTGWQLLSGPWLGEDHSELEQAWPGSRAQQPSLHTNTSDPVSFMSIIAPCHLVRPPGLVPRLLLISYVTAWRCHTPNWLCGAQSLFLVFYVYNYVGFTASQMHICSGERLCLWNVTYFDRAHLF